MSAEQTTHSVILSAKRLVKQFKSGADVVNAVNNVSFDVLQGETLAIVGESGCGKSTLGRMLLNLHAPTSGEVIYQGESLTGLSSQKMRSLRKELQMIFQDPFASLNPRMTVFKTLAEPLKIHQKLKDQALDDAVYELLELVGLARTHANSYPQEFSGGQRQRIAIARALLRDAPILVLDEATSALDTESERAIQAALDELQKDKTVLVIAHRLSTIEKADEILVVDDGAIVERGTHDELIRQDGAYAQLHRIQFGG